MNTRHFNVRFLFVAAALSVVHCNADAVTFTVVNVNDSGAGSLRQAIFNANATLGADRIEFNIPGSVPHSIRILSQFPVITDPVTIDATTQPGFAGAPIIELSGALAGPNVSGILITAGGSTVRGFVINSFLNGNGIELYGENHVVEGNYIGTDVNGTGALGNTWAGILIYNAASNRIGGTTISARNVISGNSLAGMAIYEFMSQGNVIEGNFIGTDVSGRAALGNSHGVQIDTGARDTRIGGTNAASRNIISGSTSSPGIIIRGAATGTLVQGNFIGTDITGTVALGNASAGLLIYQGASASLIGGTVPGAANLISGNSLVAVEIDGSETQNNVIEGNFIGTDVTGTMALGNAGGVLIDNLASDNRVGGPTAASRNVIAGNASIGINIRGGATANSVLGNFVGTDVTGTTALGNGSGGVLIESANNVLGPGNIISGNRLSGIELRFGASSNRVEGNLIGTDSTGVKLLGNLLDGVVLDLGAANNVIGGTNQSGRNIISGNGLSGVYIETTSTTGNRVQGNFIGTDITGTNALGNGEDGVFILQARNNTIGGSTPTARNIISGNGRNGRPNDGRSGIEIWNGASGNSIAGNFIGTDVTGTAPLPNREYGVFIQNSSNNIVGGLNVGGGLTPFGNVISANLLDGIYIELPGATSNNAIANLIGTDSTGRRPLGNGGNGIRINDAPGSNIGGIAIARNVVSGNAQAGVLIEGSGARNSRVRGNFIGTDTTGTNALGNGGDGVHLRSGASQNTIGLTTAAGRNVISANQQHGIHIEHAGSISNQIQGNFIGTDATGTNALGNGGSGVRTSRSASLNTVGGAGGARNTIAFNQADGVHFRDGAQNLIRNNSIFSNVGLGINLGLDAVTSNDAGDVDTGANDFQNFPVLLSAVANANGTTTLAGTLESQANTAFTLELFANAACDPSGYGEGALVLGTTNVTTDGTGAASYTVTLTNTVAAGQFVSATATDPSLNTSEFSVCVQVVPADGGADVAMSIASGPDPAVVGTQLEWIVAVTNTGPANATAATVTIALPSGVAFVSATPSQGVCSQSGGVLNCELGPLTNGASATVAMVARAETPGTWTGNAFVLVASGDPNLANNVLALTATVTSRPRLTIETLDSGLMIGWMGDGYVLQCATNLNDPVFWGPVTNGVEMVEGGQQLVVEPNAGNKFSRLYKK